jgi:hypothetical protein
MCRGLARSVRCRCVRLDLILTSFRVSSRQQVADTSRDFTTTTEQGGLTGANAYCDEEILNNRLSLISFVMLCKNLFKEILIPSLIWNISVTVLSYVYYFQNLLFITTCFGHLSIFSQYTLYTKQRTLATFRITRSLFVIDGLSECKIYLYISQRMFIIKVKVFADKIYK